MEAVTELTKIDFMSWFIIGFIMLSAFVAICKIIGEISLIINKPVKWIKRKNQDHDLLIQTVNNLTELQKRHERDVQQSINHDKKIQDELSIFMNEVRESTSSTQNDIKTFTENRIHDREQSFKIQKELTDAIKLITDGEIGRDNQIKALMCGSKELLGAEIDRRYREYLSLEGIPESEVDEFADIYKAYKGLNGNHSRDTKYDYVRNHLSVIPVETKLLLKNNNTK